MTYFLNALKAAPKASALQPFAILTGMLVAAGCCGMPHVHWLLPLMKTAFGFGGLLLVEFVALGVLGFLGARRSRVGHLARGDFENFHPHFAGQVDKLWQGPLGFALVAGPWGLAHPSASALAAVGVCACLAFAALTMRSLVRELGRFEPTP